MPNPREFPDFRGQFKIRIQENSWFTSVAQFFQMIVRRYKIYLVRVMIYSDLHFCLQAWRAFIALEMHWSSSLGARPEFSHLFTASSKVWKNIHFEISSCKLFHCTIQFVWESTINNLSASIVARIGLARIKTVSPGDRSLYQL